MDASLETLVAAACVLACPLSIPRSGPQDKTTDQKLSALAATGLVSDRPLLGTIGRLLPGRLPAAARAVAIQPQAEWSGRPLTRNIRCGTGR